jgi:hypothetical protein
MPMPFGANRVADIMRMMQGTMGAGGANLPSNNVVGSPFRSRPNLGGPAPPAGRFADNMDPEVLRLLMQMMGATQGRVPGSVGPGGAMFDDWAQQTDARGYGGGTMGPGYAQYQKSRGITQAPYARDLKTGRPFGASGQPFEQRGRGDVEREQRGAMGGLPWNRFAPGRPTLR